MLSRAAAAFQPPHDLVRTERFETAHSMDGCFHERDAFFARSAHFRWTLEAFMHF